ncbi:MAG TPA: enoyl-CoA hydratase-related protein, partial [Conexibacter sp.]|nr:enoyl-CoA hydratase-related protein [Conexibacter sp.]
MASVSSSLASLSLLRTTLAGLDQPGCFLRRTAAPLDFDEVDHAQRRAIVRGLFGAMHAPPGGVGLAAPMAGLDLRLVVASDGEHTLAMANPEVVATGGGEVAYAEGNLCLPGVHAEVVRPATVTVRWQDVAARPHEETFDGWIGRILFHELELLDGGFFTDRVAPEAIVATTPAQQAAAALASVCAEPEPAAPASAREPLRIVTLPPDLLELRRSVLRIPAAPAAGSGLDQLALRELLATLFLTLHARGVGELANVLSGGVLIELDGLLAALEKEPPRALVVISAKKSGFVAGADIREFTGITDADSGYLLIHRGQQVLNRLAALPCPSVAAIHGFALGGGLELALACRYRVAVGDERLSLGLPEVQLGIHPGFGGTVRSVQIAGVRAAMELMLTGKPVRADKALRLGLVDALTSEAELRSAARTLVLKSPPPRRAPFLERLLTALVAEELGLEGASHPHPVLVHREALVGLRGGEGAPGEQVVLVGGEHQPAAE